MDYEKSGFSQFLIRQRNGMQQFDGANIADLLSGNSLSDRYIKNLTADKITAGTITATLNMGTGRAVVMNGEEGRFEVWDGTTMVGFMGFMEGRFTPV